MKSLSEILDRDTPYSADAWECLLALAFDEVPPGEDRADYRAAAITLALLAIKYTLTAPDGSGIATVIYSATP